MPQSDKLGEALALARDEVEMAERAGGIDGCASVRLARALLALSAERAQDEVCWLIERGQPEGQTPTIWWVSLDYVSGAPYQGQWTEDATKARRYADRGCAELAIRCDGLHSCRATEHVFLNNTPTSSARSPEPQSTYVPLTRAQIEDWREVLAKKYDALSAAASSPDMGLRLALAHTDIETLCDMAVNSLLYAEEIHRLRAAPSATSPSNGGRRLIYNKATRKIDVVRKADGLVTDSFDPPEEIG